MFIIGNLFGALAQLVHLVLTAFSWLILIRALISWVSPDPFNPIVQFLYRATDPVLEPIRRRMPYLGGIDFSPLLAFLLIMFLDRFLVQTLLDLSVRF
ncbi:MAG: YggT family protein [Candidatus Omnitrophota bacterium]|nr:YggT family protein [Candidatus Omnitrophota bacterium]MDZ4241471.1 YggT family protein [Candidatus Omnitrophota bacterium]